MRALCHCHCVCFSMRHMFSLLLYLFYIFLGPRLPNVSLIRFSEIIYSHLVPFAQRLSEQIHIHRKRERDSLIRETRTCTQNKYMLVYLTVNLWKAYQIQEFRNHNTTSISISIRISRNSNSNSTHSVFRNFAFAYKCSRGYSQQSNIIHLSWWAFQCSKSARTSSYRCVFSHFNFKLHSLRIF